MLAAFVLAANVVTTFDFPAEVRAGQQVPFTIAFENRDTVAATDLSAFISVANETLNIGDSSGQIVAVSGLRWQCQDPARRDQVLCRTNRLEPGQRTVLSGQLVVPQTRYAERILRQGYLRVNLQGGDTLQRLFSIDTANPDTDLSLNTVITAEVTDGRGVARVTATAVNRGSVTAHDIVLRLSGTSRFPGRSASGLGWSCRVVSLDTICTRPELRPGEITGVVFQQYTLGGAGAFVGTMQLMHGLVDAAWSDNEIVLRSTQLSLPQPATEDFEPVLLPIALVDTPGALGSLWRTHFTFYNAGDEPLVGMGAFDLAYPFYSGCFFPICPEPDTIAPRASARLFIQQPGGPPGVLLWIRKDRIAGVAFELRVQDISRQATTWGTEVPVVRTGDLHSSTLRLVNVPLDARFRQALRLYDLSASTSPAVLVRFIDADVDRVLHEAVIPLTTLPSLDDLYRGFRLFPAYADIGNVADLPQLADSARVHIEVEPLAPDMRFWAFVSVTNNETQHVTLVTPQ